MRAREFIYESPSLADQLRLAVASQSQQKMGQDAPPKDTNAVKTGQTTQGSAGSVTPSTASGQQQPGGGTQTPQDGTQSTAPTQSQKPGVMGSFIKGLTGGKADSLSGAKDLAVQGAKNFAASSMGMKNTVNAIGGQNTQQQLADPQNIASAFKPGQSIDHPTLGTVKVTKVTPQGLELDTSQSPTLGVKKINIDLKSLSKVK